MPNTPNIGLSIPVTGSEVGTWGDASINPDMVAIDGLFGGIAAIALSNVNVTLTAPTGIAATAGPTQAQNAVLRFSGVLTANVRVTLPLSGFVIVENLTTGNFVVTFRAVGSGEIIATPQGSRMQIFNDGTNVRFMGDISSFPGKMEFLGGVVAVPAWMAACTVPPFLIADGSTFLIATYPGLGALYGTSFGGNGSTTSAVPDMRGRVPLAYDGTGTRITVAGCGINGQTMGAVGGEQAHALTSGENGPHDHGGSTGAGTAHRHQYGNCFVDTGSLSGGGASYWRFDSGTGTTQYSLNESAHTHPITSSGSGTAHNTVQPSQVAGIWLIKT